MSTVQAAASLFGSDDQGPDPFSAIGNEERDTSAADVTEHHPDDHPPSHSYPYNMGEDPSNLFASEGMPYSHNSEYEPWSPHAGQDFNLAVNTANSNYEQAGGVYDQHTDWLGTNYSSADSQETGERHGAQTRAVPAQYSDPYASKASITPSAYVAPVNHYAPPTQSHYEPPKPPTSTYAPAQGPVSTYSTPTNDSYQPSSRAQRDVSKPQPATSYVATPNSYTPNVVPQQPQVPSAAAGQDSSNLFASENMSYSQRLEYEPWSPHAGQDSNLTANAANSDYEQAPGLYDRHGDWLGTNSSSANSLQTAERHIAQTHAVPANYSDPYTSKASNTPSTYVASVNHYAPPTQPLYEQPKLPTSTYAPTPGPVSAYSAPTNDSYQPSSRVQRAVSQPQPAASYSAIPSSYTRTVVPPQPTQASSTASAAAYRPKTLNAYDPPLPPPKTSKRIMSARIPRSMSPMKPHQTFSSYDMPPPPLPAGARTTTSTNGDFGSSQDFFDSAHVEDTARDNSESGDFQSQASISSPIRRAISPQRGSLGRAGSPNINLAQPPRNNAHSPEAKAHSVYSEPSVASRASSPHSIRSANGSQNVKAYLPPDPYAPPLKNAAPKIPPDIRTRSGSDGSTFSTFSATLDYGSLPSRQMYPAPGNADVYGSPPIHHLYAPSPSLLGSNDPLGRTSVRAPLISFGFGGKIVTCFHGSSALGTGFDVALSSRRSTDVEIRVLHKVIPESALGSAVQYSGPLFSDPGTPITSLVRTGVSTQLKAKKASVVKYLEERAEELVQGLGYFDAASVEKRHAEGRLVLVRLLKVMVENDGVLSGSPQIDAAVRAALLPRLSSSLHTGSNGSVGLAPPSFTSPTPDMNGMSMKLSETPIAISTLFPSALDKIQEFLVRGERRQAYHYALDEKLWAHAMVIASSIDKDAWKEVVGEFVKTDLGVKGATANGLLGMRPENVFPESNGREWLRVAYSLFSGQGPNAVQELAPTNLLSRTTGPLQIPAPSIGITPPHPNFTVPVSAGKAPIETLAKWPETAAVMVSSPMPQDWSTALTALGDFLASHQWIEAAHACYLLTPQTSVMGGIGSPSTRIVLLGCPSPHIQPSFHKDPDPIIFSEIVEFAMSLKPVAKGQEAFQGLPHLQAYKLVRASSLAEVGHLPLASRYCEAISASLGRPSAYVNTTFLEQVRGLADRFVGVSHVGKPGSWIGGKMTKPSLDSIGNWLEGRLTNFIAGEGDSPSPTVSESTHIQQQPYVGPFSHYSTIASTTTSASPSPQPSMVNLHVISNSPPPRRSGSAMAYQSSTQVPIQIDRASSAMEYYRPTRKESPAPHTVPAHTTTFSQSPYGQPMNGHSLAHGSASNYLNDTLSRKLSLEVTEEEAENNQQSGGWWASARLAESSAPTPTATNFHLVEDLPASTDGFVSLMDDPALAVTPSFSDNGYRSQANHFVDDDGDDLGLGNSTNKHERQGTSMTEQPEESKSSDEATNSQAQKNNHEDKQSPAGSSGSWLSRFWKRSDAPAPIKASLGEETSFYYDKDLKRWVNKKVGGEADKPAAAPPPPSRARTTSPAMMSGNTSSIPRSMSVGVEINGPPSSKPPMRVRSNLVPPEIASRPNTPGTPPVALTPPPGTPPPGTPPPGRPRSQATKRTVRSRYVDVFQQENTSA